MSRLPFIPPRCSSVVAVGGGTCGFRSIHGVGQGMAKDAEDRPIPGSISQHYRGMAHKAVAGQQPMMRYLRGEPVVCQLLDDIR